MEQAVYLITESQIERHDVRRLLEISGHAVEIAASGAEALDRIATGFSPALIVISSDILEAAGTGFVNRVQALLGAVPFLVLTEDVATYVRIARVFSGSRWMAKPVAGVEIMKAINEVLADRHGNAALPD